MPGALHIGATEQSRWNSYLETASNVPVEATLSWIEYQTAYLSEVNAVTDRSLLLLDSSKPIALWPLCLTVDSNGMRTLSSYGQRVVEPIALVPHESKAWQRAQPHLLLALRDLIKRENAACELQTTQSSIDGSPSGYGLRLLSENTNVTVDWEIVCEVRRSPGEIWSSIRPSYRSIINRAAEQLTVAFFGDPTVSAYATDELKRLHFEAAGRSTRSEETWTLQRDAVGMGEAFIALALKEGYPVGGCLVWCSRTEAVYAVAGYDRVLMSEGLALGHLLQWKVIEHLHSTTNVRRYRLGTVYGARPSTEKLRSINHFKMGFRTGIEIRPVFQLLPVHD